MKRIAGLIAGVALAVAMTACDDTATKNTSDEKSTTVDETTAAEEDTPTLDPSKGDMKDEGKDTGSMTLTGTISAGVESGCIILEFEGKVYNLIGGDMQVLTAGANVEVSGQVAEGMMTTCQQGTPFKVTSVTVK